MDEKPPYLWKTNHRYGGIYMDHQTLGGFPKVKEGSSREEEITSKLRRVLP